MSSQLHAHAEQEEFEGEPTNFVEPENSGDPEVEEFGVAPESDSEVEEFG